jgi:hypothetical protein
MLKNSVHTAKKPASSTVGTGGKARPGRDADHSPPSSAEIMKEQELYLLSPKCASMERNGTALPLPQRKHNSWPLRRSAS